MASSFTRIGSTARLVWNLISSRAWVLVESAVPTNSLPRRLDSGSTACFCSRSSLTRFSALCEESIAAGSNTGMPNSAELAAAICAAVTSLCSQVRRDRLARGGGLVQRIARGGLVQCAVQDETAGDAGDADQVGCRDGGVHVHSSPNHQTLSQARHLPKGLATLSGDLDRTSVV